jgi:hypothetical protein
MVILAVFGVAAALIVLGNLVKQIRHGHRRGSLSGRRFLIREPKWDVRELDTNAYAPRDQSWRAFVRGNRTEDASLADQPSATRVNLMFGHMYPSPPSPPPANRPRP